MTGTKRRPSSSEALAAPTSKRVRLGPIEKKAPSKTKPPPKSLNDTNSGSDLDSDIDVDENPRDDPTEGAKTTGTKPTKAAQVHPERLKSAAENSGFFFNIGFPDKTNT